MTILDAGLIHHDVQSCSFPPFEPVRWDLRFHTSQRLYIKALNDQFKNKPCNQRSNEPHNKNAQLCQDEIRRMANLNLGQSFEAFLSYALLFEPFRTQQTELYLHLRQMAWFQSSDTPLYPFTPNACKSYDLWVIFPTYPTAWQVLNTWDILPCDS